MPFESVDVLIAGAGPAGASAAITLRALGRSVLLVDAVGPVGAPRRPSFGETLIPSALLLLERLGVRDSFLASEPVPCYEHWSVWGEPGARARPTLTNPYGPGWFIDRPRFDGMLRARALQLGARGSALARLVVEGRDPSASVGDGPPGRWVARLLREGEGEGREVHARFVLDATGRAARVVRSLGAERRSADRLVAIAAELEGTPCDGASTYVETCEHGWWYASVGAHGRPCVTLMTDADLVRGLSAAELPAFLDLFARTEAAQHFLLDAQQEGVSPQVCPAATGCTVPVVGEGWAAAGDAAVSLDPLSSRGISAALLSGAHAAQAIHSHLEGAAGALASYAATIRRVYAEHRSTQRAYYRMERRFLGSPFWARRCESEGPQAPA